MIKATIITIGDEILIGQIVDTNSVSIAKHLNRAGITVAEKISIGDDAEHIEQRGEEGGEQVEKAAGAEHGAGGQQGDETREKSR